MNSVNGRKAVNLEAARLQADTWLTKELLKLLHRIERILVPSNSLIHDPVIDRLEVLFHEVKTHKYLVDAPQNILHRFARPQEHEKDNCDPKNLECICRQINWTALKQRLFDIIRNGDDDAVINAAIIEEVESDRESHEERFNKALKKESLRRLQNRNGRPVMPGKWRKDPYPQRCYERLSDYAITSNVSAEEAAALRAQLNTPLDGFLGQAYNYDDHGLTEEWMVTFQDKTASGPSDHDIIRTQIESLMEILKVSVQDRVCNEIGVLRSAPVGLGPALKEAPVWGIDCYTRKMIELAIEDRVPANNNNNNSSSSSRNNSNNSNNSDSSASSYERSVEHFIEKLLLPAVNAQDPKHAHDLSYAVRFILDRPDITAVHAQYATAVSEALRECGNDAFKIHPKGTGVICNSKQGIAPHVFISEYLGEMYPPYRWCERLDIIEQAQSTFELKPTLPDFYNILLERPRQDPSGYGLLFVDASQKANMGSSCSHSCDPNCTSAVVARNNRLVIALTTNRFVQYGEELTMDYFSYTTSETEWRAAICLCGMSSCRGSFLHYTTQDELQQVLNEKCGPLWNYASLLRACGQRPLTAADGEVLVRHGMLSAALGTAPPLWMQKYVADNLRFLEYERKTLPCALLRSKDGGITKSAYSSQFSAADMDARSVMEQRLQSLVCCVSIVQRIMNAQSADAVAATATTTSTTDTATLATTTTVDTAETVGTTAAEAEALIAASEATVATSVAAGDKRQHLPLVHFEALQAIDVIWQRLLQIPTLLQEHLLSQLAHKTAEIESTSAAAEDGTMNSSSSAIDSTSDSTSSKSAEAAAEAQAAATVAAICQLLDESNKPVGFSRLKDVCLQVRVLLLSIEQLSTATARLGQLADVLLLWAHTTNFSTRKEFEEVESEPILVCARELGANVPRSKILRRLNYAASKESPDAVKLRSRATSKQKLTSSDSYISKSLLAVAAGASTTVATAAAVVTTTEVDSLQDMTTAASSSDSQCDAAAGNALYSAGVGTDAEAFNTSIESTESLVLAPTSPTAIASAVDSAMSTTAATATAAAAAAKEAQEKKVRSDFYMFPSEPVFEGTRKYSPHFAFWTLMGWFYAGTDQPIAEPDLFGCVELPSPAHCFGISEQQAAVPLGGTTINNNNNNNSGSTTLQHQKQQQQLGADKSAATTAAAGDINGYGQKHRMLLMQHLMGDVSQTMAWPAALKNSFNLRVGNASINNSKLNSNGSTALYGSPMLDGALGRVDAVGKVLTAMQADNPQLVRLIAEDNAKTLKAKSKTRNSSGSSSKKKFDEAAAASSNSSAAALAAAAKRNESVQQLDTFLPPELPTSWVQCEQCKKWRRVAWHVNVDELPEQWQCALNSWEPENASCDVPQDSYDPDKENTLGFQSFKSELTASDFTAGKWFDLYCKYNKVYYEAQVLKVKTPKDASKPAEVLFHFRGWSSSFNEWVPCSSERIQAHNLHTNPNATDPREQEIWQGMHAVAAAYTEKPAPKSKTSKQQKQQRGKTGAGSSKKRARSADAANAKKSAGKKAKSDVSSAAQQRTATAAEFRDDFDFTDDDDDSAGVKQQQQLKPVEDAVVGFLDDFADSDNGNDSPSAVVATVATAATHGELTTSSNSSGTSSSSSQLQSQSSVSANAAAAMTA